MKIRHLLVLLVLVPITSFAQTDTPPSAGLTPQSPFYFLDRLGETIRELVAFNPETKIRIQIAFAAERIAEIKVEMETEEIDTEDLSTAQNRLEKHLSKASRLISEERGKGKDMEEWSEILKGEFEVSKDVLESSFELTKDALENEKEEIEEELETAKENGDAALIEQLTRALNELEGDKEELEQEMEEQKEFLENQREELDDWDDDDGVAEDDDSEDDDAQDEDNDNDDEDDDMDKPSTGSNVRATST